jgi:hypothetical protein
MCIVIDSCCIACVFDEENENHRKFAPVLKWINGRGRMVYGGTKYLEELGNTPKYMRLILELRKAGQAILIPREVVDTLAAELKGEFPEPAFNDEHIVALVLTSGCAVVCTVDTAAISYLRCRRIFAVRGRVRPSIFRGHKDHDRLCCDGKITGVCRLGAWRGPID